MTSKGFAASSRRSWADLSHGRPVCCVASGERMPKGLRSRWTRTPAARTAGAAGGRARRRRGSRGDGGSNKGNAGLRLEGRAGRRRLQLPEHRALVLVLDAEVPGEAGLGRHDDGVGARRQEVVAPEPPQREVQRLAARERGVELGVADGSEAVALVASWRVEREVREIQAVDRRIPAMPAADLLP